MLRNAVDKAMWVRRATVFFVGLVVILALLLGAASMAFAKNGDPWLLGRTNVATAITKLGGAAGVNGPMLQLVNNNAGANDTALDLRVQPGEAPMRVNRATKVTNLNADKLDGKSSKRFLTASRYKVFGLHPRRARPPHQRPTRHAVVRQRGHVGERELLHWDSEQPQPLHGKQHHNRRHLGARVVGSRRRLGRVCGTGRNVP